MAITTHNHKDEYSHWQPEEVQIIDGCAVRFSDVCVHEFSIGDLEDPDLYAGEPLWVWQQSEAGQWVMAHAAEPPYWIKHTDYNTWGQQYKIMARLSEKYQIFWTLKWGNYKK